MDIKILESRFSELDKEWTETTQYIIYIEHMRQRKE